MDVPNEFFQDDDDDDDGEEEEEDSSYGGAAGYPNVDELFEDDADAAAAAGPPPPLPQQRANGHGHGDGDGAGDDDDDDDSGSDMDVGEGARVRYGFADASKIFTGENNMWEIVNTYYSSCDESDGVSESDDDDDDDISLVRAQSADDDGGDYAPARDPMADGPRAFLRQYDDSRRQGERMARKRKRGRQRQRRSKWIQAYERGEWRCFACSHLSTAIRDRSVHRPAAGGGGAAAAAVDDGALVAHGDDNNDDDDDDSPLAASTMESCLRVIEQLYPVMSAIEVARAVHRTYRDLEPLAGRPGGPPVWRTLDIYVHIMRHMLESRIFLINTVNELTTLRQTLHRMIFSHETRVAPDAARQLLKEVREFKRNGGGAGGGIPRELMESARPTRRIAFNRDTFQAYMSTINKTIELLKSDPTKMVTYVPEMRIQPSDAGTIRKRTRYSGR